MIQVLEHAVGPWARRGPLCTGFLLCQQDKRTLSGRIAVKVTLQLAVTSPSALPMFWCPLVSLSEPKGKRKMAQSTPASPSPCF